VDFIAGNLVRLKSGGPLMTVEQVGKKMMSEDDAVWCVWFEKVGAKQVAQRETFSPVALEIGQKPNAANLAVVRS